MGEMADLLLEQCHDFDCDCPEDIFPPSHFKRELRCKSCSKGNLHWRRINEIWTMFETNGSVHTCHGYEPHISVLKKLAQESLERHKRYSLWALRDKAKERGSLHKMLNVITDDQLVDLFACFVRDDQSLKDNPDIGMPLSYKNELQILRKEILKRLQSKQL